MTRRQVTNDRGRCLRYVLESCMAIFCTTMADYWSKLILLKIFRVCSEFDTSARDMFLRLDFSTWLANAITHRRTTVMEQFDLTSIFLQLLQQCRTLYSEKPNQKEEDRDKLANLDCRRPLLRAKIRLNVQKVK